MDAAIRVACLPDVEFRSLNLLFNHRMVRVHFRFISRRWRHWISYLQDNKITLMCVIMTIVLLWRDNRLVFRGNYSTQTVVGRLNVVNSINATSRSNTTSSFPSPHQPEEGAMNLLHEANKKEIMKFIPFPHRELYYGNDAHCEWKSLPLDDNNSIAASSSGQQDLDSIQISAMMETICMPTQNQVLLNKLHIFSSREAKECLVNNNVTLGIAGDSYNRQLYIGLGDILLGNPTNYKIADGKIRNNVLQQTQIQLKQAGLYTHAQWICNDECYGDDKLTVCSKCIAKFRQTTTTYFDAIRYNDNKQQQYHVIPVVGTAVHIYNRHNQSSSKTIDELETFVNSTYGEVGIIFNSPPSYQISKVPASYTKIHKGASGYYWNFLPLIDKYKHNIRYLDFFQLTRACTFDNCTTDGGHRSRFVNRWKAQLLLNTICEPTIKP